MPVGKTLLKTASYGLMHMVIAVVVAYGVSGRWRVALAIGLLEPCVQTVAFFFHERAWHALEKKRNLKDHHDAVIDSASPMPQWIENILRRSSRK